MLSNIETWHIHVEDDRVIRLTVTICNRVESLENRAWQTFYAKTLSDNLSSKQRWQNIKTLGNKDDPADEPYSFNSDIFNTFFS